MEHGVNTGYSDCEIEEFKIRRALQEARDGRIVDAAMRDLIAGNFDSEAVHEVMSRRTGSIEDYVRVKGQYETAVRVLLHTRTA